MEKTRALEKCLYICSRREYCAFDIEKKLEQWGVEPDLHRGIIKTLISEQYINNERFAQAFARDKFALSHWGTLKIRHHLKSKKIDEAIVTKVLAEINGNEYDRIIIDEIAKKSRIVKGKNDFDKKQKIARYVISKGFEPGKVFELLKLE